MKGKRLYYTIRLWFITDASKRAKFLKDHHVFGSMGDKCTFMPRIVPLYAHMIFIGNNVHLASNVSLVTHDITHAMLNNIPQITGGGFKEKKGKIVIGDNVFIGAGTRILYDVTIGENVVVGASSLVNRDIPSNTIAAGVPAKPIGDFHSFVEKRKKELCVHKN